MRRRLEMAKSRSDGLLSGKPDMKGAMGNPGGFRRDVDATKELSPRIPDNVASEVKGKGMK